KRRICDSLWVAETVNDISLDPCALRESEARRWTAASAGGRRAAKGHHHRHRNRFRNEKAAPRSPGPYPPIENRRIDRRRRQVRDQNVPVGPRTVRIELIGYKTESRVVTVVAGASQAMNVAMAASVLEVVAVVVTGVADA